ncbi:MAG: ABC transporter substrate-binding protein [Fimbriimonadaceae bacterium]|nr:ABC transporter substrate-binding protein [Fimbriimonadaceae bacterium]
MRFTRWLLAVPLFALIAGCGSNDPIIGGKPNESPAKQIVSLSPSTTEITGAKLINVTMIGVTESCNWPPSIKQMIPPPMMVMNGIKPNYEAIASLRPDLVVYDAALFSDQDIQKFSDLNIRTFGFKANTLEDFYTELYKLASMTSSESHANDYVIAMQRAQERGRVPIEPKPKAAIILPGQGSEHFVAGSESFQADMVRNCGADVVGPKGTAFMPANIEELVSLNPDVIFSGGDATALTKDPRLQSISAIKNKRVFSFNADVIVRRGGRVDRVMGEMIDMMRKQTSN